MPIPGAILCPVAAVVRAFALSPTFDADSAPFYSVKSPGDFQPLSHQIFVHRTKELISSIGRNPDDYSGNSFRIGAATLSFSLTPRHELIKDLGDWASDAYLGYNRATPQTKCLLPASCRCKLRALRAHAPLPRDRVIVACGDITLPLGWASCGLSCGLFLWW